MDRRIDEHRSRHARIAFGAERQLRAAVRAGTLRRRNRVDAGRQQQQRREVAALQRQLADHLLLDDVAEADRRRLQQLGLRRHRDGFGGRADLQRHVARHGLVDADGEGRHLGGRESREFDGELVGARANVDEGEVPAVAADARGGDRRCPGWSA